MLEPTPLLNAFAKLRVLAEESTAYSGPTIDWYTVINKNSQLFRIDIAVWAQRNQSSSRDQRTHAHTHTHHRSLFTA